MTLEKVNKQTQNVGYSLGPLTCFCTTSEHEVKKGEEGGLQRQSKNSRDTAQKQ